MKSTEFRKELRKIMPGYKWTVHRVKYNNPNILHATGIQSSGFNRMSTLYIKRRFSGRSAEYSAMSSGYGRRDAIKGMFNAPTLARALRGLQQQYEKKSLNYKGLAKDLENGRSK